MPAPIDEDTPRQPRGWYALSKAAGEELCAGYARTYALPVTVLRFAMVFGAGEILDFPQFYLSHMRQRSAVLQALWESEGEEERLVVLHDEAGRPFRKHVADVRDIVHGCLCALGKERAFGRTYQLAGPNPFTWDEAVCGLAELLGIPVVEAQPGGVPTDYEFALARARRDLGFQPEHDVVRMIVDALDHRRGASTGVLPTD